MPAFLLEIPAGIGQVFQGGNNAVVVFATDAVEAKKIAKVAMKWDANIPWDNATVTTIATPTDWFTPNQWAFQVRVSKPAPAGGVALDVTVLSDATNQTVDEIGALLRTAIDAVSGFNPAAYNVTTQVLEIAAVGDSKGDHTVECIAYPVVADGNGDVNVNSASFFGAIVHQGVAGAALSVTLAADGTLPTAAFYRAVKAR